MSQDILQTLIEQTQLPNQLVADFLTDIIRSQGMDPNNLTLDEVREIISTLAQEVLLETKRRIDLHGI